MKGSLRPVATPLLPVAISLAAGIVVGCWPGTGAVVAALLLTVIVGWLLRRHALAQGLCGLLAVFMAGMLLSPDDGQGVPDGQWTEAVVASAPVEKPKTMMAELLLTATGERRRCYIWKEEGSRQLRLGDNLLVRISEHQFVRHGDWRRGGNGWSTISSWQRVRIKALALRSHLLQRLKINGDDEEAEALIAAMVLGDKSALTPQQRNRFSVTGASHVLALSGLHLSIIYLLLTRLMLGRRRFWLSQVVVVLTIWAYALLTGLPTSLVRAATMISVYSLFQVGGRSHAPLGVLSFTAIIMLVVDSSALYDVGFQLSFMAMLAILLFVPLMESLWSGRWMMEHRVMRWMTSMLTVTVAAQIGTAPLVAYYFGRFSTWFLLTNLVVLPLTMLILYAALAALLWPALTVVATALVRVMSGALDMIATWPLASVEGLHPSVLQVALCYVAAGAFYVLLTYSRASARCR